MAESGPRLPKTMAWTVTAVPRSSGMPSLRRYVRARSLFQERNTASMAWRSWSHGSSGTSATPTIERKLATKRSRQLRAKASLTTRARPSVVASFRPRFRIVSIIPGIDTGAPDRTLTRSGSVGSPKRRPTAVSTSAIRARISSSRPSGQPFARNSRQVAVVIAKPGGTGRPRSRAITPRFAALPPTSAFASSSVPGCWASRG